MASEPVQDPVTAGAPVADPIVAPMEVGDDEDNDSAYDPEDGNASDTTSLSSSVSKYRFENGRRYHGYKDGLYMQPNDEQQLSVQDMGHHMMLILLENELHLAPISENPQRILDVGTGTGIWAIDMADQHKSAQVVGTDLSPVQPAFVPPNCKFEIDDASVLWTFTPGSMDFVFFRFMLGSFSDWTEVYREAFKTIKPGGWIEHHEVAPDPKSEDGTVTPGSPFHRWGDLIFEAGDKLGKTYRTAYNTEAWIEEAGFINVVEKKYKMPIGRWPADAKLKEIGMWFRAYFEDGMEGYAMALLTRVLEWDFIEAQAFFGQLRAAFKDKKTHAYCNLTVVYGQKPLAT
ncbi:S-adenosyl-L-methionine-dependent methyltransferase [Mollisia scopiformis]|uniref:S-adenosyl-L-methionine-dependent methyltransferase n=1 Tax=Mollisia scopiformis TaxID=149040 RepID=A0A132B9T4_MOLSC|nr:S-adenosyl-L-methionine-dependent methyltransferase [Mollisia scopiformis]KUJ08759.1 S-adenosyl-L-methionine-dependent methyltransferase [Mollisia scopiformis]